MGLAHPVSDINIAACRIGLHPPQARRVAGLSKNEVGWAHLKIADQGDLRFLEQYKGRSRTAVRHHVRHDGDLVWRAVLRAVFHAKYTASRLQDELRNH